MRVLVEVLLCCKCACQHNSTKNVVSGLVCYCSFWNLLGVDVHDLRAPCSDICSKKFQAMLDLTCDKWAHGMSTLVAFCRNMNDDERATEALSTKSSRCSVSSCNMEK